MQNWDPFPIDPASIEAGHILGTASIDLHLLEHDQHLVFREYLGRSNHPLPAPIGDADVVVVESTCGDENHPEYDASEIMASAINEAASRGGVVVIPAFAVDRTEVVLWHLKQLFADGRVLALPVFVDSPMALRALEVYAVSTVEQSTHADQDDLVEWIGTASQKPVAVYVNHGETPGPAGLVDALAARSGILAVMPQQGERVMIEPRVGPS